MAPEIRYEDVPTGAVWIGHQGINEMCVATHDWSKDMTVNVVSRQSDGSSFAIESVASGTNTGSMGSFPATGKTFSIRMASLGSFGPDGSVVEHRDYWDLLSFLGQIGLRSS
jgi:hypothetical protein